jgi:hypothetical protein
MTSRGPDSDWTETFRQLMERGTNAYSEVLSQAMEKFSGAMGKMDSGGYQQQDVVKDLWELAGKWWESTAHLASLPFDTASTGAVPSVLFVVHPPPGPDDSPTAHDPTCVFLRAALDKSTEVVASPLVRIDAQAPPANDVITLDRDGRRLRIGLQNLLSLGENARGHHVASVYADEAGNKVPLAIVHVVFPPAD